MRSRDELIRSQLEQHAPNKECYSLVAKSVNVGIALLVYARDDGLAKYVTDVQTQWTGCGPGWMGNKGAVGVRFRVQSALYGDDDGPGEVYTFVNAHLAAHLTHLQQRIADYQHIAQTLLFKEPSVASKVSNMYNTTHLFFFGDLNFRIDPPKSLMRESLEAMVRTEEGRDELRQFDQLSVVRSQGKALVGLREGEFWKFQCTYKYKHGQVDQYQYALVHPVVERRLTPWQSKANTVLDGPNTVHDSR